MAKTLKPTTTTKPKAILKSKKIATPKKNAKGKGKKKVKLTDLQKEQNIQQKEIRNLMQNIGFARVPYVDGTHFMYEGRQSELDDIFYFENIVVLTEYTVGDPGTHIKEKKIIYDKINQ